jgi:uncharacterized damage-inducible protein DinB
VTSTLVRNREVDMQTSLELYRETRKAELPKFVSVLKSVPQGRLDYRPDPKARTAQQLAWVLAQEEAALATLIETGTVEWKDETAPGRIDDIVSAFERSAAAVNQQLEKLDAAGWEKKAKMLMGAGGAWEDGIGQFLWGFLLDAIHHRGQLSTYLRPMGSKVPSIYGPSADDPGQ